MTEDVNNLSENELMKKSNQAHNSSPLSEFSEVTAVFEAYPKPVREKLLALRQMILETAVSTPGVGEIIETLKWGQPSYLTVKPKSGTTIRIGVHKTEPGQIALYVHCQTSLIDSFRQLYPTQLSYEGNRAILLKLDEDFAQEALRHCITLALTYHLNKK
ncbi:FIG00766138: hypothetical protein [hydrothermal vent metagenome]|uniref:YdhG-like domain-containing protein n=1 Tax=hydrothermal vent metagenome TaxID=652676 RepID=A0A3B0V1Z4_9ZZZZ